jgi:hypothetical protein
MKLLTPKIMMESPLEFKCRIILVFFILHELQISSFLNLSIFDLSHYMKFKNTI